MNPALEESPFSSDLYCGVCSRDLSREVDAELECGHKFHVSCVKQVLWIIFSHEMFDAVIDIEMPRL